MQNSLHRSLRRNEPVEDITHEQAYGLCLLSVIIAVIGLGTMVLVLL
jgi:hypothetical protein